MVPYPGISPLKSEAKAGALNCSSSPVQSKRLYGFFGSFAELFSGWKPKPHQTGSYTELVSIVHIAVFLTRTI
jgi:hypothetical protein